MSINLLLYIDKKWRLQVNIFEQQHNNTIIQESKNENFDYQELRLGEKLAEKKLKC